MFEPLEKPKEQSKKALTSDKLKQKTSDIQLNCVIINSNSTQGRGIIQNCAIICECFDN